MAWAVAWRVNNELRNKMLEGILSISGKGGLYKMVSQGKNSVIVESLQDGKRMPVGGMARVSSLHEISMYTRGGDVSLQSVMAGIYRAKGGKECLDGRTASSEELRAFMDEVLPEWDSERVYVSDIRKLATWYNILVGKGLVSGEEEKPEGEAEDKGE